MMFCQCEKPDPGPVYCLNCNGEITNDTDNLTQKLDLLDRAADLLKQALPIIKEDAPLRWYKNDMVRDNIKQFLEDYKNNQTC